MPLRKRKLKPASTAQKKGRIRQSTPSLAMPGSDRADIVIDTVRGKNYEWIIEGIKRDFVHKRQTPMPLQLKPTLASITDEPFNDKDWQFEIKWDGYRSLAYVSNGKAELFSRNNLPFNRKYASIAEALRNWQVDVVVDGEIVVLSEDGKADFAALQAWDKKPEGELIYFVFDIIWVAGIDIRKEPLSTRREILRKLIPESGPIRFSDDIDEYGIDFFKAAKENGLEGIIGKRKSAPYQAGIRTKDWLKIKAEKKHEAIICGYTRNEDSGRPFSALLLGVPKKGGLQFIGSVGTGFTTKLQSQLMKKMGPLERDKCPFEKVPRLDAFVQWLQPSLLCEVKYTELTKEGVMRHASFQGLREDKFAEDINVEEEVKQLPLTTLKSKQTTKEDSIIIVDQQEIQLSNLSKIYWKKEGITKGKMIDYYLQMAPFIIPYMKDRPQSLNRFPNGVNGESFYQKNMKGKVEPWLKTFERLSESSGESKDFLVCSGTASLIYMANLGCIEMNPWHSRVTSPNYPDWCVIDLDPGEISFEKVIETAQVVHSILHDLQIESYPKTSGSTGIHIYIPLGAKYNYEQSRQLAELVATLVHNELPSFTSLVRNPAKRQDKIYIDYLQNRPIQTICAPYSLRPKPGATVSAPLHWDEVKTGLKMSQFTISTILQRVQKEGDLFKGVLGRGIDLNAVLQRLAGIMR